MDDNQIALTLSGASAAFALASLIWNYASFHMSGPRISIDARHAALVRNSVMYESNSADALSPSDAGFSLSHSVELIRVTVSNFGRSPVFIAGVAFLTSETRPRRCNHPARIHDKWIEPSLVSWQNSPTTSTGKLDPGESWVLYFNSASLFGQSRISERPTYIRAFARFPVKNKRKMVNRKSVFTLPPNAETLTGNGEVSPSVRVYRAIWNCLEVDERQSATLYALLVKKLSVEEMRSRETVSKFLQSRLRIAPEKAYTLAAAIQEAQLWNTGDAEPIFSTW